eukprot:7711543-Pyramimonas_sp.AAC.1
MFAFGPVVFSVSHGADWLHQCATLPPFTLMNCSLHKHDYGLPYGVVGCAGERCHHPMNFRRWDVDVSCEARAARKP